MHASVHHWALVLAGGDGTRLQSLTREITGAPIPKQYCRLLGDRSLLQATLGRAARFVSWDRILVILNRDHLGVADEQLRALAAGSILVQPCNRDTGPGLLFALGHLMQRDPDATVAVFPSDHYVGDDETFIARVSDAARLVAQWPQKVAMLGVHPDRPESGFGYITVGRPFAEGNAPHAAFQVDAFREKPNAKSAEQLAREGALWNCFVMVFKVRHMIELLARVVPAECEQMLALHVPASSMPAAYARLLPWNFSSRVLTRIAEHLVVLRVDGVYWSDCGTAEAVHRTLAALHQSPPWVLLTKNRWAGDPPATSAVP